MATLQAVIMLVIFFGGIYLMFRQKVPAFLCMILMAVLIAIVAGLPVTGEVSIATTVFAGGVAAFSTAIFASIFGGWLGCIMDETGITRDLIRRASELAGDKTAIVAIVMSACVAILFTSLQGFGATIAVGTLVLPILTATGCRPKQAAVIFMLARTLGNLLNPVAWVLYQTLTGLENTPDMAPIATVACVCIGIGLLIYIVLNLILGRRRVAAWAVEAGKTESVDLGSGKRPPVYSLITPVIPLILVGIFKWDIIISLFAGVVYGAVTGRPREIIRILSKTFPEGIRVCIPGISVLIGAGFLYACITIEPVYSLLLPIVQYIVPSTFIGYIIVFSLMAPLALYRGPMNTGGMGVGFIALILLTGKLPLMAVCAAFMGAHIIHLSSCPTNSHNIWVSDYVGIDVTSLTINLLPYVWPMSIVTVIAGAFMYM